MKESPADKRRKALKRFMDQRNLRIYPWSKRAGVSEGSIRNFLSGESDSLNQATVEKLARAERVTPGALLGEVGKTVPVLSYIGAGARVYPVDDFAMGGGMYEVEAPAGEDAEQLVALEVRGDSMRPIKNGWVVMYRQRSEGVEPDCLNQLCVVALKDGSVFVKELRPGYEERTYNLDSWNAEPVLNAQVKWAARVVWIKQR